MQLQQLGYDNQPWVLVDTETERPVEVGDTVTSFRGDEFVVQSGTAPHKVSSAGRVYVHEEGSDYDRGFYPSVVGLSWRHVW